MMDTSWMIPAIKGDQTGFPWVKFGGDRLNDIDVLECAFALPFWDMSDIDHVRCFDLRWKFLLSPRVRWARIFVAVLAWRPFPFMFGVKLAGLFKDPTVYVGMIGRLIGGAVNLARPIEYSVQTRWTISISFE